MSGVNSFADVLPNNEFLDTRINDNIMNSGPPNVDSDSDFNRNNSSLMKDKVE